MPSVLTAVIAIAVVLFTQRAENNRVAVAQRGENDRVLAAQKAENDRQADRLEADRRAALAERIAGRVERIRDRYAALILATREVSNAAVAMRPTATLRREAPAARNERILHELEDALSRARIVLADLVLEPDTTQVQDAWDDVWTAFVLFRTTVAVNAEFPRTESQQEIDSKMEDVRSAATALASAARQHVVSLTNASH